MKNKYELTDGKIVFQEACDLTSEMADILNEAAITFGNGQIWWRKAI